MVALDLSPVAPFLSGIGATLSLVMQAVAYDSQGLWGISSPMDMSFTVN